MPKGSASGEKSVRGRGTKRRRQGANEEKEDSPPRKPVTRSHKAIDFLIAVHSCQYIHNIANYLNTVHPG